MPASAASKSRARIAPIRARSGAIAAASSQPAGSGRPDDQSRPKCASACWLSRDNSKCSKLPLGFCRSAGFSSRPKSIPIAASAPLSAEVPERAIPSTSTACRGVEAELIARPRRA